MYYFFEKFRAVVKKTPLECFVRKVYKKIIPLEMRDSMSRRNVNPYSDFENKNKIVFVHVPKNAGNGVAESLFGMKPKGHNFLVDYKKNNPEKYENFFKFGFSRNVYSRFYSAYSYLKKGGFGVYDEEFSEKYIRGYPDFNSFVKSLEDPSIAKKVISWTHFIPQTDFFLVEGVCELDYLGSVEEMEESLEYLSKKLNLEYKGNKKVNSSNSSDYRAVYDDDSIRIVSALYEKDISFLKCEF